MALLSGFQVSRGDVKLMGAASVAAFDGKPIPTGWDVVTPAQLELAAQYRDGDYFNNGNSGASAIVLKKGTEYIISFRGTDDDADKANYLKLADNSYVDYFKPLLNAVLAAAPANATFSFTGVSLGGGAVNNMANVAATAYGGRFADATFVSFASPNISNKSGIVNFGFENDPVYKLIDNYAARPSSLDHLVLATDEYLDGNYDGRHPFSDDAHSRAKEGFEAIGRLSASNFYNQMQPDSVVIFAASDSVIQDQHPARGNAGVFYLGQSTTDRIVGRAGNDFVEGFSGNDVLTGGAGNDRIKGGDGNDRLNGGVGTDVVDGGVGNDRLTVAGTEARLDRLLGGADTDTLQVIGTTNLALANFDATAASIEIWRGNGKALIGDAGANSFDFSALDAVSSISFIDGRGGNDTLVGSDFADVLRGGTGADTLTGGEGNDTLTGGANFDTFFFSAAFGHDTITDFSEGTGLNDVVVFADALFADFAAVMAAAVQVGKNVEIRYDADTVLTINDASLTGTIRLISNDFDFV